MGGVIGGVMGLGLHVLDYGVGLIVGNFGYQRGMTGGNVWERLRLEEDIEKEGGRRGIAYNAVDISFRCRWDDLAWVGVLVTFGYRTRPPRNAKGCQEMAIASNPNSGL